ncbi:hypothetical protein B9479_007141 [Cryptococcus floricola]|uniref:Uncharacterized protein n=1 Tax=Cryptococcus floricola TaxID=2591691 RepID=A0A5D3AL69_9TREE|nr:hypothetical protein B9479_007141 [Cryptococcus floricola]
MPLSWSVSLIATVHGECHVRRLHLFGSAHIASSFPRTLAQLQDPLGPSSRSNVTINSNPSAVHLETIQLGKLVGKGAIWDVYEITNAPGYAAKICFPGEALLDLYGWNEPPLDGAEHIQREIETNTGVALALRVSKHVPLTCGLWYAYWEEAVRKMDDWGWEMYVAIQEDVRQDGKFSSSSFLTTLDDLPIMSDPLPPPPPNAPLTSLRHIMAKLIPKPVKYPPPRGDAHPYHHINIDALSEAPDGLRLIKDSDLNARLLAYLDEHLPDDIPIPPAVANGMSRL